MPDKNHSMARRSAALLATVCTLGSLAVTPIANAAPEPEPSTTQQTTNQPQGNADVNANADGANEADAVANVATVTSPDGQTTSYPTFSAALAASKAGETVTLTANSDESTVRVDKKITVTSVNGAVYSGTMTVHDGATIKGMTFSLTGAAGSNTSVSVQGAGDVKIEGNAFGIAENAAVTGYYGVYVQKGSARVSISNNTFNYPTAAKNHNRTAIYLTGQENTVTDVTVANNTMKVTGAASNKGQTVFIDASGGRNDYGITNLTVTGNTVSATAETKSNATGIYVQGVKGLTFTDNTFTNLSQAVGSGAMPGQNTTSTDIKVGGNDFTGTDTGYGFEKGSVPSGGLTITKPDKVDASRPSQGIVAGVKKSDSDALVTYVSLADAIKDAEDGDTVQLLSSITLDSVMAINKKIILDGQGYALNGQIRLAEKASDSIIQNVKFVLNSTSKMNGWSANIYISAASNVKITNNTFMITADAFMISGKAMGVYVFPNQNAKVDGTQITNNTFDIDGTAGYHIAIHLSNEINDAVPGITNTVISGNTMVAHKGASSEGVFLVSYDKGGKVGVDGVTVSGNQLAAGGSATGGALIDFWGGAKNIDIIGNTFGSGNIGVYLRTQNWGSESAPQENVDIKNNTFNSANGVVVKNGVKTDDDLKYTEYQGTENANKFGANTRPYVGNVDNDTEGATYGVTYRDAADQSLLGWEEVVNGDKVQNVPTKLGYTVTWYKDANVTTPFDPAEDAVTSNITLYAVWAKIPTPVPSPSPDPAPTKSPFIDVIKDKTPHYEDILWLADQGISTGWKEADGTVTFRPATEVNRQDMAAFLYRLAGSPRFDETKAENPFVDVTAETPHYKEILWLYSTGITTGYRNADGTLSFQGLTPVYRQDMAAFLHRLAEYGKAKDPSGKAQSFTDVNGATPHAEDIAWLSRTGVTEGYPDGSFGVGGTVLRQDMAAFLHRMHDNVLK
ncbi:internalin [Bifidobacterium myosotis]|uniref:Internalin n=1 Tax=Bifidobacterium myosotis TaxID=1630166 RepID=A0A261FL12_9BIFI|nr:S-layer homology domain-containing protein [Bifidobacterium myosotis]OZG59870.1 internalin [Bifidobacterium myosotis]